MSKTNVWAKAGFSPDFYPYRFRVSVLSFPEVSGLKKKNPEKETEKERQNNNQ